MCGIFGSSNFRVFEQLYAANCSRGSFAGGCLYTSDSSSVVLKWPGIRPDHSQELIHSSYTYFNGHTQAPTGSQRQYDNLTTHPFSYKHWIVAHNGVLENHEELTTTHELELDAVDSAVIPKLLDVCDRKNRYTGTVVSEIQCIVDVAEMLQGTFACWLHNSQSKNTYIIRSGSTLFGDVSTGVYSSMRVDDIATQLLDEGVVYSVTNTGLNQVNTFNHNSPFFI